MDKSERIIFLLPYRLMKNPDPELIEKYYTNRKKKILTLFIIACGFSIFIITIAAISGYQSIQEYVLSVSSLTNAILFGVLYKQNNFSESDIFEAISGNHSKKDKC